MPLLRWAKILCFYLVFSLFFSLAYLPNGVLAESGPEVNNVYHVPEYPIAGDDVTIYATVTDPDGVKDVNILYCDELVCYLPIIMTPLGDNIYSGTIHWDASWGDGTVIGYKIKATDNKMNITETEYIHYFFVSEIELSTEIVDSVYAKDIVTINGTACYNGNESAPVENSNVTVRIISTIVGYNTTTDENGKFSLEITFENPGDFQINITISNRTMESYDDVSITVKPVYIERVTVTLQLTTCYQNQKIWVNGTAKYNTKKPVINSDVEIRLNGTLASINKTDPNGNYFILITAPENTGEYSVNVTVINGSMRGYNESSISVTKLPTLDLVITMEDISFESQHIVPLKNDNVNITVIVHNLGSAGCHIIAVHFYDGELSQNNLIGSGNISQIPIEDTGSVSVNWIATNGTHEIWISVDPSNIIEESFEDNNNAFKTIFVDNDFDGDEIGDQVDLDDDNDGYLDKEDDFPYDNTEWIDTDSDGIGNNVDEDDDGDGLSDAQEEAKGTDPLDPDSDDDGVNDKYDYNPLNPRVQEKPSSLWIWLTILLLIIIVVIVFSIVVFTKRKRRKKNHK